MSNQVFIGENLQCLTCWKLKQDGKTNYCELSCKNIKRYSPDDKCRNRSPKYMGK